MPSLLLAFLFGCTLDEPEPSGVFVGNPGKLELTAARSVDYDLVGTVSLDEMLLGACGTDESVASPLEGRELSLVDDGVLRFELDEPLQIPPGAWCRLELVLGTTALTATGTAEDGNASAFELVFEGVSIGVSGQEFVVDDQLLALELGQVDWLTPLAGIAPDDPDNTVPVDVLAVAPGVHAALRSALEDRSALFLTDVGEGADANTDLPPEAEAGSSPLWSGDEREPTLTEPTDPTDTGVEPTDTGIVDPPDPVDLQVDPFAVFQQGVQSLGRPVFVYGDLVYVPGVTQEGSVLFTGPDYVYDPAMGLPVQLEATGAALATDDQQLYLMSATLNGAAIDVMSIDSFESTGTTPFPGGCEDPVAGRLANGPVFTWLDGGQLRFVYATDGEDAVLADGVLEHDLGTDQGDGMLITWLEGVGNPLSPNGSMAQFTAYLAEDRTVLFDGTPSATTIERPKVALSGELAVVARLEGDLLVADVYGIDGIAAVPLQPDVSGVEAYDLALVGDVLVLAWSGPDGVLVQLLDVLTGLPITEAVPAGDAGASDLAVTAIDQGVLRFAIAAWEPNQATVLQGFSEDALLR